MASGGAPSGEPGSQHGPRPVPHRCSGRLDDVVTSCMVSDHRPQLRYRWGLFVSCVISKPGEQPRDAFINAGRDPERPYDLADHKKLLEDRQRDRVHERAASAPEGPDDEPR